MKNMRTKMVLFSTILVLIISPFYTYADDLGSEPSSSAYGLATDEQVARIDALDREAILIQAAEGTKAVDYAQQIYLYLQNPIYGILDGISGDTASLDTSVTNISSDTTKILKVLYGSASVMPSSNTTLWYLINQMSSSICYGTFDINGVTVSSPIGDISLIKSMLTGTQGSIYNLVGQNMGNTSAIVSQVANIYSRLGDIQTGNININTSINNLHKVFDTTSDLTMSYINYATLNNSGDITNLSNPFTIDSISEFESGQTGLIWWFNRSQTTIADNDKIYLLDLPVTTRARFYPDDVNIKFIYLRANTSIPTSDVLYDFYYDFYDVHLMVEQYGLRTRIYFQLPDALPISRTMGIFINSDVQIRKANNNIYTYCINSFDDRYYDVKRTLIQYEDFYNHIKTADNINKLTEIYASDAEIQAREESEQVMNQALEDFTGVGSGSIKLSDISNASAISSSLQLGLNSGGYISDSLSVFNPANAFWGWFSSDNAQYFTPLIQNRNNPDAIPNILSVYDSLYEEYINGDSQR